MKFEKTYRNIIEQVVDEICLKIESVVPLETLKSLNMEYLTMKSINRLLYIEKRSQTVEPVITNAFESVLKSFEKRI